MRTPLLLAALALPALAHTQHRPLPQLPVDSIVARNVRARGGLNALDAIRSLVYAGPRSPAGERRWMAKARPNYWVVGEPIPSRDYAEGNDGSSWEYFADPGLSIRTTHAPAAAARHTSYFDDPLVYVLRSGWQARSLGTVPIAGRPTYGLRVTYPDSFQVDMFVDPESWLVVANRKAAPVHAFGAAVLTETRISDYRSVNGVLFAHRFQEFDIKSGAQMDDGGQWESIAANTLSDVSLFSPPANADTPLVRMLASVYASRNHPSDALGWYRDFKTNPATSMVDTQADMGLIIYQCLKTGGIDAAIVLARANAADYPKDARAYFSLGRALAAAGRTSEAIAEFQRALALNPQYERAKTALAEARAAAPRRNKPR